ncbi:MAG: DUF2125 domain-containing protein [Rhodospirillales bacterium]|nr:DUF2125 domain-containing protein [Rhodospirillales bacterium]
MALRFFKPAPPQSSSPRHAALDYRPPLSLRLIRRGLQTVVAFAVLGVIYTVYWFVIATQLKDGMTSWIQAQAGPGFRFEQKRVEISGFPTKFRIVMSNPRFVLSRLSEAADGDKWEWRAVRFTGEMRPWNFDRFVFDLSGNHEINISSKRSTLALQGSAKTFRVEAGFHDDGLPADVELKLGALSLNTLAGNSLLSIADASVNVRRLFPDRASAKTPTFALKLGIKDLRLPPGLNLPLGPIVSRLSAEMKVLGAIFQPGAVDAFAQPDAVDALGHWRDEGGVVEVARIEAKYGPLDIQANGTIALDDAMQPMVAMTARARGFFPTVDALKNAKLIRSRDAAMAKLVLGALAERPKNGGAPAISLPLTIQNGFLFAGPIKLLKMPPIKWPQKPKPADGPRAPE